MAELILELPPAVRDGDGNRYVARVHGERDDIGRWRGWLEFTGADGTIRRTEPETIQSSRDELTYWASGLEPVYLEGAFQRAQGAVPRTVSQNVTGSPGGVSERQAT